MGSTNYAGLLEFQQDLGDEFEEFRTGYNPARRHSRNPGYGDPVPRKHPRKGRWFGLDAAHIPAVRRPRKFPFRHDVSGDGSSTMLQHARRAAKKMSREVEVAGFRFVRILGFGGLGVASLYEAEDKNAEMEVRRRVVCKMDLWETKMLIRREINSHLVCDSFFCSIDVGECAGADSCWCVECGRGEAHCSESRDAVAEHGHGKDIGRGCLAASGQDRR